MNNEHNIVEVRNVSDGYIGEAFYSHEFETSEQAYEKYCELIKNFKETLRNGEAVDVIRYRFGYIMTAKIVRG